MRGFYALKKDCEPRAGHGLRLNDQNQTDIFQTAAEITGGTFASYLAASNAPHQSGTLITLQDAFLRIIEMGNYVWGSALGKAEVFYIKIEAYPTGRVLLKFQGPAEESDFRTSWQQWFPKLKDICSLEPTGTILVVDSTKVNTSTYAAVCEFCGQYLEPNLQYYDDPTWFAIRHLRSELDLPRPAFYFIAAFILSSVVRYQPELLLHVSNPDSEQGWLIARFLGAAERYFPHLLLSWWLGPLYF